MAQRFPAWIKKRLIYSETACNLERLIDALALNTVCKSACCPNKSECFSQKKATFMILGKICTRNCGFCAVKKGRPLQPDKSEAERVTNAVKALGLNHAVITSVTRDDLEDGGARQFYDVAFKIKGETQARLEILTPDFRGKKEALDTVLDAHVDIFCHNLETVPRLYSRVRPEADYKRSLEVLKRAKKRIDTTKSGIMVGLGEREDEVFNVMRDLREIDCKSLTIGQYLRPTKRQLGVYEYVHPDLFNKYRMLALSLGFKHILSEPFARTSYM